jgi:hypothetical protein
MDSLARCDRGRDDRIRDVRYWLDPLGTLPPAGEFYAAWGDPEAPPLTDLYPGLVGHLFWNFVVVLASISTLALLVLYARWSINKDSLG